MSANKEVATCALPPALVAFRSLKARSIAAWQTLSVAHEFDYTPIEETLRSIKTLDDLLNHESTTFYFLLTRDAFLSATRMNRWDRNSLENYTLLAGSTIPLLVNRTDCIFISHYYHFANSPDPNGRDLHTIQRDLRQTEWLYAWLDWSCNTQTPSSGPEANYATLVLASIPYLIRNCAYMFSYPCFQPRLWILYETAEYMLTTSSPMQVFNDNRLFVSHVNEMMQTSVRAVIQRYGYRCSVRHDAAFITAWLEILILLRGLRIEMLSMRHVLDLITLQGPLVGGRMSVFLNSGDTIEIDVKQGYLTLRGQRHTFARFPDIRL